VFTATGIRLAELAGIRYHPGDPARSDLDLHAREIRIRGKGGTARTVKIGHQAARSLDRYLRARTRHTQAWRPQLWLGVNNRGPLTATGIYQIVARRGRQAGVNVYPHRFRHHFSHTWLDRGGAERDLMELNGWTSPQMLTRYGARARGARARRSYDRIMDGRPDPGHCPPRSTPAGTAIRWTPAAARATPPTPCPAWTRAPATQDQTGSGPQNETIAVTQSHLPHNPDGPPAAPIAEYLHLSEGGRHRPIKHRSARSVRLHRYPLPAESCGTRHGFSRRDNGTRASGWGSPYGRNQSRSSAADLRGRSRARHSGHGYGSG
jgi:Phage integrase family